MTEPESVTFRILGKPVPKGRPRFCRGLVVTPKRTRMYERVVHEVALLRCSAWRRDGVYRVTITLVSHHELRGDLDNYCKGLLDGMQGAAFENDRQVAELRVRRQLAMPHGEECAEVLVERIGDRPAKRRKATWVVHPSDAVVAHGMGLDFSTDSACPPGHAFGAQSKTKVAGDRKRKAAR